MKRKETVTKIIDSDTIETSSRKKPIKIQGLDTPEKGQQGYSETKTALSDLIKNEKVTVEPVATDDYGRVVAKVKIDNKFIKNRDSANSVRHDNCLIAYRCKSLSEYTQRSAEEVFAQRCFS